MITVLLLADEPCYCAGFLKLTDIQNDPETRVAGSADTIEEGSALVADMRPTVVVLDMAMVADRPGDLARVVAAMAPGCGVIALGASPKVSVEQAFALGVRGYLLKSAAGADIIAAIKCVARGDVYLDPRLVTMMIGTRPPAPPAPFPTMMSRVSEREMAVLKRTAYGYSAKEIARDLSISHKSVETYKARATAKLGLGSRSAIIRYANTCGWFSGITDDMDGMGRLSPS